MESNRQPLTTILLRLLRDATWYDHYSIVRSVQDQVSMDRLLAAEMVVTNGEILKGKLQYKRNIKLRYK